MGAILITGPAAAAAWWARAEFLINSSMNDLVYVAVTVAFFVASALYVTFCDTL